MRDVRLHRPLLTIAATMAVLCLVCVGGLLFDDRELLGAPIWLKPFKFTVSMVVYTTTLAWLISLVQQRRRAAWWVGTVVSAAAVIEMAVIVGQVVRGRQSHFNVATPLDSALFSLMGVTIVVLWVATALLAVILWRQRMTDRPAARAIRLGMLVALGGLAVGFLMTTPTAEQRAAMADGPPTLAGAHSVGVPDGGPGLPVLGWSTEGGDLRAGHFIGMHALQALPLLALGLALAGRRVRRLRSETVRARLVAVGAAGYGGLTVLVTWQALRGQSVVAPDVLTVGAGVAVLAATAAGAVWALRAAERPADVAGGTVPSVGEAAPAAVAAGGRTAPTVDDTPTAATGPAERVERVEQAERVALVDGGTR